MTSSGPVLRNPLTPNSRMVSQSSISICSDRSSMCRFRMLNSLDAAASNRNASQKLEVPIIGYEVIEERARFTVYKLRIQNTSMGDWFVFRRYTDFVRLHSKIKSSFPEVKLLLPRKRWFGDNFDPQFLEERVHGLQKLVNSILNVQHLYTSRLVRDFFCLDEPPTYAESVEESRAIFEALEDTIGDLRQQLKGRDAEIENLRLNLSTEMKKKDELFKFVTSSTKKCAECIRECQKVNITTNPVIGGGGDNNCNMPHVMQLQDVTSVLAQLD